MLRLERFRRVCPNAGPETIIRKEVYLRNVDLLFRYEATRGRPCSCSFRSPSAPMTTAQRVEAFVGPVPGSSSRILVKAAGETPAPESSRMSVSLLATESVTLVQVEVVMFRRRRISRGQNCWARRSPRQLSTGRSW
jgi:hypothetical protein